MRSVGPSYANLVELQLKTIAAGPQGMPLRECRFFALLWLLLSIKTPVLSFLPPVRCCSGPRGQSNCRGRVARELNRGDELELHLNLDLYSIIVSRVGDSYRLRPSDDKRREG